MHKYLPKIFIFLDHYNNQIFKIKKLNIGVIYRNYKDNNREKQLIKIAQACKKIDTNFLFQMILNLLLK
jgi:hypothetical protein